jgi:hypothetical protein
MARSRVLAVIVLALLGAPVAMHVVMHDLHGHHHDEQHADTAMSQHGDHEHPLVGAATPAAPRAARTVLIVHALVAPPQPRTERDLLSHGALRIDDDVGLQPLLSTFLI